MKRARCSAGRPPVHGSRSPARCRPDRARSAPPPAGRPASGAPAPPGRQGNRRRSTGGPAPASAPPQGPSAGRAWRRGRDRPRSAIPCAAAAAQSSRIGRRERVDAGVALQRVRIAQSASAAAGAARARSRRCTSSSTSFISARIVEAEAIPLDQREFRGCASGRARRRGTPCRSGRCHRCRPRAAVSWHIRARCQDRGPSRAGDFGAQRLDLRITDRGAE